MKLGRAGTMTHDYKRHGTTTLFAVLNILDGTVIGRNMQRHRHQEFVRFLNTIEAQVPVGKVIHAVVDNYATHKHPRVRRWLAVTRAGPSTSPRPRRPGLTPLKASSPSSHASGSSAASSIIVSSGLYGMHLVAPSDGKRFLGEISDGNDPGVLHHLLLDGHLALLRPERYGQS